MLSVHERQSEKVRVYLQCRRGWPPQSGPAKPASPQVVPSRGGRGWCWDSRGITVPKHASGGAAAAGGRHCTAKNGGQRSQPATEECACGCSARLQRLWTWDSAAARYAGHCLPVQCFPGQCSTWHCTACTACQVLASHDLMHVAVVQRSSANLFLAPCLPWVDAVGQGLGMKAQFLDNAGGSSVLLRAAVVIDRVGGDVSCVCRTGLHTWLVRTFAPRADQSCLRVVVVSDNCWKNFRGVVGGSVLDRFGSTFVPWRRCVVRQVTRVFTSAEWTCRL